MANQLLQFTPGAQRTGFDAEPVGATFIAFRSVVKHSPA